MLQKSTNRIDLTDTRLRINCCALSSRKVFLPAPLFLSREDTEFRISVSSAFLMKNKGALLGILVATKGATVGTQAYVDCRNDIWRFL
jgi:hypothetical protein